MLAAGIPRAFAHADYAVAVAGYIIMRVALIAQWLRAAHGETGAGRKAAMTYAGALAVVQAGWVLLLLLPAGAWVWGVGLLIVAELAAPAVAERVQATPWHAEHIADRYGAFTIIVLGESISAATVAVQSALDEKPELGELLPIAFGGLVIVFTAFWVYFATPINEYLRSDRRAFAWGYGHYLIFGSAAAIGAGLEVATEQVTHHSHISDTAGALAVTGPAALYTAAVWLVHVRPFKNGAAQQLVLPVVAVLELAVTFAGHWAVPLAALAGAAGVATALVLASRRTRAARASRSLDEAFDDGRVAEEELSVAATGRRAVEHPPQPGFHRRRGSALSVVTVTGHLPAPRRWGTMGVRGGLS